MENLPHHYTVNAKANAIGDVSLSSDRLVTIYSAPPAEFGGPGDKWSPETLLIASVADCFILTFKAIARASKVEWNSIDCAVEGTLDRVNKVSLFTQFQLKVILKAPAETDQKKALHILEKAEQACLITNSLSSEIVLDAEVQTDT